MFTSSELYELSKIQMDLNVSAESYSSIASQSCDCTGCEGTCTNTSSWLGSETY